MAVLEIQLPRWRVILATERGRVQSLGLGNQVEVMLFIKTGETGGGAGLGGEGNEFISGTGYI